MPRPGVHDIESQLRLDEGEVLHAYQDQLGYWTIGIGRLIDQRKGGGITHDEAAFLVHNDIQTRMTAVRAALPWFDTLSPPRQGVLLNMAFQLGIQGLLGFTNTLRLIHEDRYTEAAAAMLQSQWATQTPERAQRLAEQMRLDAWQ